LLVAPAMPVAAREILRQLGREQDEGTWPTKWGWPGGVLTQPKPVFPRVEPDRQAALIAKWAPPEAVAPAAAPAAKPEGAPATPPADIAYDDFQKLDLRAAKVTAAERVPKADKLLRFTIDLGEAEPRQILAGIAQYYEPEKLIGRKVIVVANLAPRKLRGFDSQGMILAASIGEEGRPVLAGFLEEVPNGAKLK
jgi:methionyl-tRNA synthetase